MGSSSLSPMLFTIKIQRNGVTRVVDWSYARKKYRTWLGLYCDFFLCQGLLCNVLDAIFLYPPKTTLLHEQPRSTTVQGMPWCVSII